MPLNDDLLVPNDAAAHVRQKHGRRCTAKYLAKLRSAGGGPLFYRRLGMIGYRETDLDAWAAHPRTLGPFARSSEAMEAVAA